jgi:hypothetical protein
MELKSPVDDNDMMMMMMISIITNLLTPCNSLSWETEAISRSKPIYANRYQKINQCSIAVVVRKVHRLHILWREMHKSVFSNGISNSLQQNLKIKISAL